MKSPINLELMNALANSKQVIVPCANKQSIAEAQEQTVDYWMRHKRGKGWVILTIDINTWAMVWWEHSLTEKQSRQLGAVKPSTRLLEGMTSPHTLVMLEADKWTPHFIYEHATRLTSATDSRFVVYSHTNDW